MHSLVKNGAHALIRQLEADPGTGAETRSLAASMLILAEEARQLMLTGGPQPETVGLLWDCVLQAVPGDRRAGLVLHTRSRELRVRKTDYGLARRILPDLVTNAWKAGQWAHASSPRTPPSSSRAPTRRATGCCSCSPRSRSSARWRCYPRRPDAQPFLHRRGPGRAVRRALAGAQAAPPAALKRGEVSPF